MSNAKTIVEIDGRNFTLTPCEGLPQLKADLAKRGWEPMLWVGISKPVGRQRKTYTAHVYRNATTGAYSL